MAIPLGKTAGNLESIARWILTGVVVIGSLTWWMPGYRLWAALSLSLMTVLLLWLIWKTVAVDRTIPGHPLYPVLLIPGAILVFHGVVSWLHSVHQKQEPYMFGGALDMSMLFQLWLLGVGILLCQSLLPKATRHAAVMLCCGGAMELGALLAITLGQASRQQEALGFLGLVGVSVLLTPLYHVSDVLKEQLISERLRSWIRRIWIALAVGMVMVLAGVAGRAVVLGMAMCSAVLLVSIVLMKEDRRRRLVWSLGLGLLALTVYLIRRPEIDTGIWLSAGWFGRGENAFSELTAGEPGWMILVSTLGWVGFGVLLAGVLACVFMLLISVRKKSQAMQYQGLLWATASLLAGAGLLSEGGLFLPVMTLTAAFVWGLIPATLDWKVRNWNGLGLVAVLIVLTSLLGLGKMGGGLVTWMMEAANGDKWLHAMGGFFLAMTFAWYFGGHHIYAGAIVIVLAALGGGVGEIVQWQFDRHPSGADWMAHLSGCFIAMILYLLSFMARWCESSQVQEHDLTAYRER